MPPDYPIAAKRPVLDTQLLRDLQPAQRHLVDVKQTPITEITPTGSVGDVEHELDIIIFATGYDAFTGPFLTIDFRGRDGVRSPTSWADGPTTYLGLQVAGFPNLLTVNGPCSPAVLTNVRRRSSTTSSGSPTASPIWTSNGIALHRADR